MANGNGNGNGSFRHYFALGAFGLIGWLLFTTAENSNRAEWQAGYSACEARYEALQ